MTTVVFYRLGVIVVVTSSSVFTFYAFGRVTTIFLDVRFGFRHDKYLIKSKNTVGSEKPKIQTVLSTYYLFIKIYRSYEIAAPHGDRIRILCIFLSPSRAVAPSVFRIPKTLLTYPTRVFGPRLRHGSGGGGGGGGLRFRLIRTFRAHDSGGYLYAC